MAKAPGSEIGPVNVKEFESSVYGHAKDPVRREMKERFQDAQRKSTESLEVFRDEQQAANNERVRTGDLGPDFAVSEMFAAAAIGHLTERLSREFSREGDSETAGAAKKVSERAFRNADTWGRVHDGNPTPEDAEVVRDTIERYQWYIDHEATSASADVPEPAQPTDRPDPDERAGRRPADREDPRVRESRERIERARRARERGRTDRGYRTR